MWSVMYRMDSRYAFIHAIAVDTRLRKGCRGARNHDITRIGTDEPIPRGRTVRSSTVLCIMPAVVLRHFWCFIQHKGRPRSSIALAIVQPLDAVKIYRASIIRIVGTGFQQRRQIELIFGSLYIRVLICRTRPWVQVHI
jgi:hypothetical protein